MANSFKILRSWNYIWDRLTGSGFSNPFGAQQLVIDESLTLYVATTGNDNNPGTQNRPFLTIQAALDYIKQFEIAHTVTVSVEAGNFAGFSLNNINCDKYLGNLLIQGTLSTLDSGTATSGTAIVTSGATVYPTLVDSGKAWSVNAFKGKWVNITSGALVGNTYLIASNTPTALTVISQTSFASIAASTYEIVDTLTNITTAINSPVILSGAPSASAVPSVAVAVNSANLHNLTIKALNVVSLTCLQTSPVIWQNCAFTQLSNRAIFLDAFVLSATSATVDPIGHILYAANCYFKVISAISPFSAGSLRLGTCLVERQDATGGTLISSSYTIPNRISHILFREVLLDNNNASGSTGIILSNSIASLRNVIIQNSTTAISATTSSSVSLFTSLSIVNCTTGISATLRANVVTTSPVIGSGVTNAYVLTKGAVVNIPASSSLTGSTADISVDGVTSTLAAYRALSPIVFPAVANAYGSYVHQ